MSTDRRRPAPDPLRVASLATSGVSSLLSPATSGDLYRDLRKARRKVALARLRQQQHERAQLQLWWDGALRSADRAERRAARADRQADRWARRVGVLESQLARR